MRHWLKTPAGQYLLQWEQAQIDAGVTDLFGFHALQLGLPELDGLRSNRMPHRWLAVEPGPEAVQLTPAADCLEARPLRLDPTSAIALRCDFDALPFPNQSLDLVVLPHTLELAPEPHETLREVERVLRPEGRVVIVGFNPTSLWGLRQRLGHLRRGLSSSQPPFMPAEGEFLGYWRLRDWLRLLSFHIERGRFGCYRPPLGTQRWLDRFAWMEPAGDRWWPVLGAVYYLVAVKRVRGMRLVGLARRDRRASAKAPAVVANRGTAERRGSMPHTHFPDIVGLNPHGQRDERGQTRSDGAARPG